MSTFDKPFGSEQDIICTALNNPIFRGDEIVACKTGWHFIYITVHKNFALPSKETEYYLCIQSNTSFIKTYKLFLRLEKGKGKGRGKEKEKKKVISSMEPSALDTALVLPGSK